LRVIGEIRYSRDHLWVRVDEDGFATIGISDYLQELLGEISAFSLPDEGEELVKDENFSIIETPEGRLELVAPISGEVSEVNEELLESPELANEEPYNEGWSQSLTSCLPWKNTKSTCRKNLKRKKH